MDSENRTRTLFEPIFTDGLQLPNNDICKGCDAGIKQPLLPWIVGSNFDQTEYKLVFAGKPHRGAPGELLPQGILDPTAFVEESLWDQSWPYWSYSRSITEQVYGTTTMRNIAFTNIIKCTNTNDTDKTTRCMAESCLIRHGVFWRELAALKAQTIVAYTHNLFPDLLTTLPIAIPGTIQHHTDRRHKLTCGIKKIGWWDRSFATNWHDSVRLLVVSHPERQRKAAFVELITNWVKGG